jgi:hypothetical protein
VEHAAAAADSAHRRSGRRKSGAPGKEVGRGELRCRSVPSCWTEGIFVARAGNNVHIEVGHIHNNATRAVELFQGMKPVRKLGIFSFNLIQKISAIYVMTCMCMCV